MANTIQRQTLTAEAAKKLVAAAEKKASELKKPMVIAVCDESGNLKEFTRMDNAPLLSVQIAQDKAYTAISFGIATHEWFEFIKEDPPLPFVPAGRHVQPVRSTHRNIGGAAILEFLAARQH